MGVSSPVFRKKRGDKTALLASAVFQAPLAQSNPYAKVAYFGVAYPATLQICYTDVMKINEVTESRHLAHSKRST